MDGASYGRRYSMTVRLRKSKSKRLSGLEEKLKKNWINDGMRN